VRESVRSRLREIAAVRRRFSYRRLYSRRDARVSRWMGSTTTPFGRTAARALPPADYAGLNALLSRRDSSVGEKWAQVTGYYQNSPNHPALLSGAEATSRSR